MTMGSTRHTLGGTNATMRSTFGRSRTSHSASRRRVDPKTGQMIETFTGRTQPTVSRADTKVWLLTKRPGPGEYKTASSLGRCVVCVLHAMRACQWRQSVVMRP